MKKKLIPPQRDFMKVLKQAHDEICRMTLNTRLAFNWVQTSDSQWNGQNPCVIALPKVIRRRGKLHDVSKGPCRCMRTHK